MSLISSTLYFLAGFFIAFIFPRIPGVLITRGKGFNTNFPPHPEPIPLSPYLTQRILHMRMFYWLGLMVSIVPLAFGLVSVRWGNVPFGFGLWISSGWFVLSRLQVFVGGPKPPWTLEMAEKIQVVINDSKSASKCCAYPSPSWLLSGIYCTSCDKKLEDLFRPDLGRKRSDGFFMGTIRLLSTDGYPMFDSREFDFKSKTDESEE